MTERKLKKPMKPSCETCVHFEWDDEYEQDLCNLDLDEDEVYRFEQHRDVVCPYYRYYDEYKSVQKQN